MPPKKSSKTTLSLDNEPDSVLNVEKTKKLKKTKDIEDKENKEDKENNEDKVVKAKVVKAKVVKDKVIKDKVDKVDKVIEDKVIEKIDKIIEDKVIEKTKKITKKKSVVEKESVVEEEPIFEKPTKGGKKTGSKKIIENDNVSKKEDTLLDFLMKKDQFNKEEKEKLNSIFELNKTEINKNVLPIDTLKILWTKFIIKFNILQKEITTCETERDLICKCLEIIMSSEQKTVSEDILDKPTSSQKKIITKINKISNNLKNNDDDDKTSNTTDNDDDSDSDSDSESDEDATSLEPIK